jgi:hypothetical protein
MIQTEKTKNKKHKYPKIQMRQSLKDQIKRTFRLPCKITKNLINEKESLELALLLHLKKGLPPTWKGMLLLTFQILKSKKSTHKCKKQRHKIFRCMKSL